MHHYDASEKVSAVFAAKGVNTWEIDIWEPNDWEEVDGKIKAILKGNPKALLLLRVGLPLYPDDEEHKREIATAEDGTRWTQMLGRAKWFKIGEITDKDAPAGKWTHIVLDISHIDREGVCRLWDFLIWHNEPIIPKGAKLRFYMMIYMMILNITQASSKIKGLLLMIWKKRKESMTRSATPASHCLPSK
jgi:hypothetical protein